MAEGASGNLHRHHGGREEERHGHRGRFGWIRSVLDGHDHDHSTSVDHVLEGSTEGIRALKLSLAGLGATAVLQLVVVGASASVALLADTVHNLADALTAVPLWVAFVVGRRRPTARYTYGYGRAEDLAGLFVVVMIALSGALAAWEAVDRFLHPRDVRNVGWVIVAGLVGFAGNELVAFYRVRVGRRIGSAALVADGRHARADGITSLGVVVGGIGVSLGFEGADPAAGALITAAIAVVLWHAIHDVFGRLLDRVEPELAGEVEAAVRSVPGVEDVDSVRIRWIGHELRAEIEIMSDRDLTLAEAHSVSEAARHRLLHDVPRLGDALIHSSPCHHDASDPHADAAHHRRAGRG